MSRKSRRLVPVLVVTASFAPGCPDIERDPDLDPIEEEGSPDPSDSEPDAFFPSPEPAPGEPELPTTPFGIADPQLSEDGGFALGLNAEACLRIADLETGDVRIVEEPCGLRDIAAGGDSRAWILDGAGGVHSVSLPGGEPVLVAEGGADVDDLFVAPGGAHLALADVPETAADLAAWEADVYDLARRRLVLVDTESGASEDFLLAYAPRDLDFTADRLVVTEAYWDVYGLPRVFLQLFDLAGLEFAGDADFSNCADDLKVEPGGPLAALSPRTCSIHDLLVAEPETAWDELPQSWDPISIVDLETGTHLGNTPGFGPAEWAPDGRWVVGFTTEDALMEEWNLFPLEPFGVVVVDTDDMSFETFDLGIARPDFVFGPDGESLFVRSADEDSDFTARIHLPTGELHVLAGPTVALRERVQMGSLFATDQGQLFRVDAESGVTALALAGATGSRLHARPQGDLLVWTDLESGAHHLVDPVAGTLSGSVGGGP